jgi:hypothetical protein
MSEKTKAYRLRKARLKMWKEGKRMAQLFAYGMSRAEYKARMMAERN